MEKGILKDSITMQKRSLKCAGLNPVKISFLKLDRLFGFTQIVYQTKAYLEKKFIVQLIE